MAVSYCKPMWNAAARLRGELVRTFNSRTRALALTTRDEQNRASLRVGRVFHHGARQRRRSAQTFSAAYASRDAPQRRVLRAPARQRLSTHGRTTDLDERHPHTFA